MLRRKVNELKGFAIGATDGDIGKVIEFYFDDQNWTVRYLVADTGSWLAGRKVLVSPVALRKVDWKEKSIHIALTKEQVEESPNIDTDKPVSRQQETAYSDYYNYPYYWAGPYLWGPASFPRRVIAPRTTGEPRLPRQGAGSDDVHLRSTKAAVVNRCVKRVRRRPCPLGFLLRLCIAFHQPLLLPTLAHRAF